MKPHEHSIEAVALDLAAALSLFLILGTVSALVMAERLPLSAYALAHVGCGGAAAIWVLKSGAPWRRQALVLFLCTFAMGPVGAAGAFLCAIFELCFRPFATPFVEWFKSIFPDENDDSKDLFVTRLHASDDPLENSLRIASFRDIMTTGSVEQKQALLSLIANRFSPAFAPALKLALQDPVASIRVQAAAAMASIETKYAQRSYELSERAESKSAQPEDKLALALHLIEFADSGIPEAQRQMDSKKKAIAHLESLLATKPMNIPALAASAKILMENAQHAQALERTQRAISAGGATVDLLLLQVESLMQLGRFNEIRSIAKSLRSKQLDGSRDGQRLSAALKMWNREFPNAA